MHRTRVRMCERLIFCSHEPQAMLTPPPVPPFALSRHSAKKSKKRARGKEDESGEKREDGSSGTEKRPRGEGKQQEEEGQEQQQQPGEGGAGAANGGVGGGDVDAATRKALAKAAIGIVKKVCVIVCVRVGATPLLAGLF